jgi:CRISPR-associated protein Csm3
MTLNVFNDEIGKEYLDLVYACLRLIQDDYLGGGGSRGNGQVKFKISTIKKREKSYYETGTDNPDIDKDLCKIPDDLK